MNVDEEIEIGPGGTLKLKISPGLSSLLLSHNKYQSNLPIWEQYMIWRYTTGSGQLNKYLIGIADKEKKGFWVYDLFLLYNIDQYGIDNIGKPFQQWNRYFLNPRRYNQLSIDKQLKIADEVIETFAIELQRIILDAPVVLNEITVYKISESYSELPTSLNNKKNKLVKQTPFNSSTYDPEFNFAPFLSTESNIFTIVIPPGSHILAISQYLHAYPHEHEILLPYGSIFDVQEIETAIIDYIPLNDQKLTRVQKYPYVIGQVYRVDPICYYNVKQKEVLSYDMILKNKNLI